MKRTFFCRSYLLPTIFYILFSLISFSITAQEPSASHDEFLNNVEEASFRYFQEQHNPHTGLVRDSAPNRTGMTGSATASIAGTGFALTVYPVAVERGWMSRASAYELTVRTLEFFLEQAPQHKGFFYHFLNFETGERVSRSELSPIDTALFLSGALFAAEYYDNAKIRDLVRKIYERVDFPWMLNGGGLSRLPGAQRQVLARRAGITSTNRCFSTRLRSVLRHILFPPKVGASFSGRSVVTGIIA